jgi:hypothetical protein
MKNLFLAAFTYSLLAFSPNTLMAGQALYEEIMTIEQAEYLKFNGVGVNIIRVNDRLVSRRARAYYEASLTNPYNRSIKCSIELISSRGSNEKFEVIDSKTHLAVFVAPKGVTKVFGDLEIKHGRGDDGLQWISAKGHLVSAKNCLFL